MTTTFKKLVLVAVLIIFSAGMASAQAVRVGVAAEPYPPFTTPDASGNWSGWEIEIMEALCEAAKLDCVITPTAWDGIIPALMSKKIDMIIASMSITRFLQVPTTRGAAGLETSTTRKTRPLAR